MVRLADTALVTTGGGTEPMEAVLSRPLLWAAKYSDGPSCLASNDPGAGLVRWRTAQPNNALRWTGWLIFPGAVTPNDPIGTTLATRLLFSIDASVGTGGMLGVDKFVTKKSPALVYCAANDPAMGVAPYLAASTHTAKGRGCS